MKKLFMLSILISANVLAMNRSCMVDPDLQEEQDKYEEYLKQRENISSTDDQKNSKQVTFENSQGSLIDKAKQKWEQFETTHLSNNKYWNNSQEVLGKIKQSQFTQYINKFAQLAQKHNYITTGAIGALGYIWNGYIVSCDSYMKYANALGGAALVYLLTKKDVQEKIKKID